MQSERHTQTSPPAAAAPGSRVGWLVAPVSLLTVFTCAWLLPRSSWQELRWAVLGCLALALMWGMVSVFFPSRPDQHCPACGAEGLERLDARSLHGLRCRACGHEDPEASAFLIAEGEGAIEEAVLAERRAPPRDRKRSAGPPPSQDGGFQGASG